MKRIRMMLLVLMLAFLSEYVMPTHVSAITAGELKNLKLEKHYFSTGILADNQKIWISDPSRGRYLILVLSAETSAATWIFANDFILSYYRNNKEDRAVCSAVGVAKRKDMLDLILSAGTVPSVRADQGKIYLSLAFPIESDVDAVTIQRINGSSIAYRVGKDRPRSVFIATHINSQQLLSSVKEVLENGGYEVVDVSNGLSSDISETIIYYNEQSEQEAREISQRIMTKFGIVPTLKKTIVISAFDIILWFGEKPQKIQL